jgi:hypothetical protein
MIKHGLPFMRVNGGTFGAVVQLVQLVLMLHLEHLEHGEKGTRLPGLSSQLNLA